MGPSFVLLAVVSLSSWISLESHSYMVGTDPNHRAEYLDIRNQNFYLEWQVNWVKKVITFNVTAATQGFILFGFANNGSSTTGGDAVIGGVLTSTGQAYFSDRYIFPNGEIRKDSTNQDDYVLHSASENGTHTKISFSRPLDTCDLLDYPISENRVTIIWGYGDTDDHEIVSRSQKNLTQGTFNLYLLDPDHSPRILRNSGIPSVVNQDNLQVWSIRRQIVIPANATSYICSIHKAPQLSKKHHMIGFDVHFQGSRRQVHHLVILKCNAPKGQDPTQLFGPFEGSPGETCYTPLRPPLSPQGRMPTYLCSQAWLPWALGRSSFFLPPQVGIPFGKEVDEYYMMQVHYDNPENIKGLIVDMRVDTFYTSFIRPNDGGVLGIGQESSALPPSILLPPGSTSHRIFHHCPGECTTRMFPQGGVKIFAGLLHSHRSGRSLRVRHFRGEQELPWILFDDNYANEYQQIRELREEIEILPGDQLTVECIYDNTWANGTVVGGYSTKQEMCFAFLFYHGLVEHYSFCRSEIVSVKYRQKFLGISNVTWNEDKLEWEGTTPPTEGLTITQVSDNLVEWDVGGKRDELRRFHEAYPHVSRCSRDLAFRDPKVLKQLVDSGGGILTGFPAMSVNTRDDYSGPGLYPFWAKAYEPEQTCSYGLSH